MHSQTSLITTFSFIHLKSSMLNELVTRPLVLPRKSLAREVCCWSRLLKSFWEQNNSMFVLSFFLSSCLIPIFDQGINANYKKKKKLNFSKFALFDLGRKRIVGLGFGENDNHLLFLVRGRLDLF